MKRSGTRLAFLVFVSGLAAQAQAAGQMPAFLIEEPPGLCSGYGTLETTLFSDWEMGLGSWSAGTRDIANPDTFDTPDWAAVGSLPDGRPGQGAFVANLNIGDCGDDDETGVLHLTSPVIDLPAGAQVPRIAFHHWFATEVGFDGGNLKLRKNGGAFELIPDAAIDFNGYVATLTPPEQDNSNPLAGEPAYTGTHDGQSGAWAEVRVDLHELAQAGDSVEIRFEFGIDQCFGLVGWYLDDVRIYHCSDELPPSDCGNGIPDPGEQCDDGNDFIGDGCSNTCQVEAGWECTEAIPPGAILDPGFEQGTPNPDWIEASTNFGSPICDIEDVLTCDPFPASGPASGSHWAWFGGIDVYEDASLEQTVTIPVGATRLNFQLEAPVCDSAADYLEVLVDENPVFRIDGSSPLCGAMGYVTQEADISAFGDGGSHSLKLRTETFAANLDVTNFFVDDLAIPGKLSVCMPEAPIFHSGFESD
jgi:cysteine-rich repeat protein